MDVGHSLVEDHGLPNFHDPHDILLTLSHSTVHDLTNTSQVLGGSVIGPLT